MPQHRLIVLLGCLLAGSLVACTSPPWHIEPEPGGPQGQLYKLDTDIGETQNLYLQHPQQVTTLSRLLNELQQQGRSSK